MSVPGSDNGVLNYLGVVGAVGNLSSASGGGGGGGGNGGWLRAMAQAMGSRLDAQANRISELTSSVGEGADHPSQMVAVSTEAMRMQFLSQSTSTSMTSVGQALDVLAKKN